MITLLNEFALCCTKRFEDIITQIINVKERKVTDKWKWEKTLAILRNDVQIEDWKKHVVKSKCKKHRPNSRC